MTNHSRRSRRTRRLVPIAAGLGAALALSGCGFVNAGGGDDEDATGPISTYTSPEQNTGLEEIYAAYTAETGTEIDASFAAAEELNQQLRVQLTSGTAADLIRVSPGFSSPVASGVLGGEGELADLSDAEWAGRLDDSTRSLAESDGDLVAYPVGRNAIVMAYNIEVFDELGLEVPTTWSELINASEEIEASGRVPIAAGLTGGIYLQFFVYALASTLVYGENPDLDAQMQAGETTFADDESWNEVFEKFVELSAFFTPDSLGVPADQAQQSLARGEAGMTMLVSAGLPQLYEYSEEGAEAFGVFAMPSSDDAADTRVPVAPDFIAVNASSPRVDEAKELIEFIAQPENIQSYAATMGVLPGISEGVEVPSSPLDPLLPLIDDGRTAPYANYLWPNGDTQQALLQGGQQLVAAEITVSDLLSMLDEQYVK